MPTFCRHGRFVERCPICSAELPAAVREAMQGRTGGARPARSAAGERARERATPPAGAAARTAGGSGTARRGRAGEHVRVRREQRALADGYASPLLPGVRASADARRLAEELAFASGRLLALAADPPGMYGELRALAGSDRERAAWGCFLIAYLGPLEEADGAGAGASAGPGAGHGAGPGAGPGAGAGAGLGAGPGAGLGAGDGDPFAEIRAVFSAGGPRGPLPELAGVRTGPRSAHDPARGGATLAAYAQWLERAGEEDPFVGDPGWSPERRFKRIFERLALPGLGRAPRYELLVTLGRLGIYELRADSLELGATGRGTSGEDLTTHGAKRLFAIGDPLLLERRAQALARAAGLPIEALDLAISNWAAGERATLGVSLGAPDVAALERARSALGLESPQAAA